MVTLRRSSLSQLSLKTYGDRQQLILLSTLHDSVFIIPRDRRQEHPLLLLATQSRSNSMGVRQEMAHLAGRVWLMKFQHMSERSNQVLLY